jgi:uncharacterized membrane protein YvlD (DUF360 family)
VRHAAVICCPRPTGWLCLLKTSSVVGAICFWVIEKFVNDGRLANLLKILVVLVCLGAILQRVLPLAGINLF